MPDDSLKPALRAALRTHEIGNRTPYEISFAQKANSGGSFGFMQGDLAAGQAIAHSTFRRCMAEAGMPEATIGDLEHRLSTKGAKPSIITADEKQRIDAAFQARRDLVDAMDESILQGVYRHLDTCVGVATDAGRTIDPIAQLYIAMWVNMTGAPTKLLDWLRSPDRGDTVTEDEIQDYLRDQKYYKEHPKNFPHIVESADEGAKVLPA